MDLATPAKIFAVIYKLFVFTPDIVQYGVIDDQRSHAQEVKQGKKFKDDCDGFALTAQDLLIEAGYQARVLIVKVPGIGNGFHMIAVYKDHGVEYTMDNRYPGIRSLEMAMSGSLYR